MDSEEKVREKIITIFLKNPSRTYKSIANEIKVSRQTVSRVIKVHNERRSIKRKLEVELKKVYLTYS